MFLRQLLTKYPTEMECLTSFATGEKKLRQRRRLLRIVRTTVSW